jgi:mannose-6-phosphate isomerase-like protein (cupin superfamily)
MMKTQYDDCKPSKTKDGSIIRELMHPVLHGNRRQSLAEAIVPVGAITLLHRHLEAEEIYYITAGSGIMVLGDEQFPVAAGDTVCIMPNTPHRIANSGTVTLILLCCCSPAYSHDDTYLL